jgi:uncharacterized Zn-binding protein involved in type VI secretion
MPQVHRKGDIGTGHGNCGPRPNIQGSPNVFTNGIETHREGDAWAVHCDHGGSLKKGSSTVFINGKGCARIGDPVTCGSRAATHSPNVFAGG